MFFFILILAKLRVKLQAKRERIFFWAEKPGESLLKDFLPSIAACSQVFYMCEDLSGRMCLSSRWQPSCKVTGIGKIRSRSTNGLSRNVEKTMMKG